MNRSATIVIGVVAALVLLGGGFFAGRATASTSGASPAAAASGRAQLRQGGGGARGAGALNGQVLSVGNGTVTVQLNQDQGSRIALVNPQTRVVKTTQTPEQVSDLAAGDRVTVVGEENSDGTVNATAIVVGGLDLQQFLGGGRPSPSPGR